MAVMYKLLYDFVLTQVWNMITKPCGGKKDDSISSMARRSTNVLYYIIITRYGDTIIDLSTKNTCWLSRVPKIAFHNYTFEPLKEDNLSTKNKTAEFILSLTCPLVGGSTVINDLPERNECILSCLHVPACICVYNN